jgi:hypothetical protein
MRKLCITAALLAACAVSLAAQEAPDTSAAAAETLGSAREADLKLGAAAYMDMQAAKFLGGDPAPHAEALKFITGRGQVNEADIKEFMTRGIAAAVDAEFNKARFMTRVNSTLSYACILARTANNQYILNYESYPGTDTKSKKELSGTSLETLAASLSGSGDFPQSAVDTVRDNAALIPAVIFDGWKKYTPDMVNPYELLTKALADFYITPNNANYQIVRGIAARSVLATIIDGDEFSANMSGSIGAVLISLNQALMDRINGDLNTINEIIAASDVPAEPQYGIFTLNRKVGDEIFIGKKRPAG